MISRGAPSTQPQGSGTVESMNTLPVGTRVDAPDSPMNLKAKGFNRHTFWCGQSGSGKTYALGVVLEQLVLNTELPILILDPNSDFTKMRELRDTVRPEDRAALEAKDIRVFHSSSDQEPRLHTRFTELSMKAMAGVLKMDPIKDAEEFNALLHTEPDRATFNGQEFLRELLLSGDPARQKLAKRIDNLQVLNWDVWALSESNITDTVAERPDVTVADLGGFEVADESKTAALAILEDLWKRRSERRPILIVIDEAHNLCPAEPNGPLEQALTDQLIQIAAEGRKFGLWLLLSTQRPTKIHQNVLSQCDNLALLRMNAPRDLQEIESVFGFAPAELIRRSSTFTQGQVLFAGGFVEEPAVAQMGLRLTAEGGADVKVPIPDITV